MTHEQCSFSLVEMLIKFGLNILYMEILIKFIEGGGSLGCNLYGFMSMYICSDLYFVYYM
jgi:hypothetical protein